MNVNNVEHPAGDRFDLGPVRRTADHAAKHSLIRNLSGEDGDTRARAPSDIVIIAAKHSDRISQVARTGRARRPAQGQSPPASIVGAEFLLAQQRREQLGGAGGGESWFDRTTLRRCGGGGNEPAHAASLRCISSR